jgi:hypothetical protein
MCIRREDWMSMEQERIRQIAEDYADGEGQNPDKQHPFYPYRVLVQMDEMEITKLYYLCKELAAEPEEFSRTMFHTVLDLAWDAYEDWTDKDPAQVGNERQDLLWQMDQQGFFENFRPGGSGNSPEEGA